MMIELCDCTATLLAEIASTETRRDDIAKTYALAMKSSRPTMWASVNLAIAARWSESGLLWIKRRAWQYRDGKRPFSSL